MGAGMTVSDAEAASGKPCLERCEGLGVVPGRTRRGIVIRPGPIA